MTVSDGDLIKVVVDIDCPSLVVAQNVFHYQLDDSVPDNPTNAQILTAIDTEMTALYQTVDQLIHSNYSFDEAKVDRVEWNVDVWETVESLGIVDLSVAGTAVGGAAPHGVAVTLTGDTSRPQSRARKFIPGFSEGEMADSTLSGTVLTALALFALEWLSGPVVTGSATLEPAIASQSGPTAGTIFLIVSAAANAITGYQRRRKPGVGA